MVDIHCHILPQVDDGAEHVELKATDPAEIVGAEDAVDKDDQHCDIGRRAIVATPVSEDAEAESRSAGRRNGRNLELASGQKEDEKRRLGHQREQIAG